MVNHGVHNPVLFRFDSLTLSALYILEILVDWDSIVFFDQLELLIVIRSVDCVDSMLTE